MQQYLSISSWMQMFPVTNVPYLLPYSLRPEDEEEVAEHKATFLDALKGLEAARKCRF
jgi:hypothetical protein